MVLTKQPPILRQIRRLAVRTLLTPASLSRDTTHYNLRLLKSVWTLESSFLAYRSPGLYNFAASSPPSHSFIHPRLTIFLPYRFRVLFFLHLAMSAKQSMADAWDDDDWESQADVSFTCPATSPYSPFSCDLCI